ncbi:MAG: iron-sulfur cluster assembly scaffold protein [Allosphingosinicella sp.]|uniref:iron-sulfur cluster assembly scaffold protein n=1 Tax=Allosphingosinicella sp. TaxID=2823234 RepID=UPI003920E735
MTLYTRDILRLAVSIPHLGRLERPDGSAERQSRLCGSRVTVDVRLRDGRIAGIGLELSACALGQASANLLATHAIGRSGDDIAAARDQFRQYLEGESEDPGAWPGLGLFAAARDYPARHAAILLPFDAAAAAADAPGAVEEHMRVRS